MERKLQGRTFVYALKFSGPLINVLHLVYGEQEPPMDYLYEIVDRAKDAIQDSFNNENIYRKDFEIIDNMWKDQLYRPLHASGNILNQELFYDNNLSDKLNAEVWQ